ncbi:MAG: maleate cis-trans isomerase family protein [Ruegeria sp.]
MSLSRGGAKFGVLVPFTNTNLEPDMVLLRPPGASLHFSRMGGYDQEEIPDAEQMSGLGAADIDEPLRLLQGARPDVVIYGCTSATLTHGPAFDRALAEQIKQDSGAETVTAAGALVHALQTLGARRIGFASPYVSGINDMAVSFFSKCGVDVVSRSEVDDVLDNYGQGSLDPQAVFEMGLAADHPDADALVLSCTDMRSVEILQRLEERVGKPVVSSNQAMVFQAKQLAGVFEPAPGYGMLLADAKLA